MNIDYLLLTHGIGATTNATTLSSISNFTASSDGTAIQLSWTNPTGTNFLGVRIQRKIGSYPTNHTDGNTVFDGFATSYLDKSNIVEGATYYYRAFAYDYNNTINNDISQQISITFNTAKIYTVIIDSTNSNPETAVSYADDAIGMTAGSNNWDSVFPFNEIKPVMLLNGTVNYYLNPNNFAQKINGTAANITSGADGDVMIQFPKVYTYIRKVGNLTYVSLSNSKVDANYKCYAHTKGTTEKDYLYISAYFGNNENGRLGSLSGSVPGNNRTIAANRLLAEANGTGYQLYSYYQHLMIQVLYLIKYKNLNSQAAVGRGYSDATSFRNTGGTNTSGMTNSSQSGTEQVKLFGIEDLWGNLYCFIDGIVINSNLDLSIGDGNYNDLGTGYTTYGKASNLESGYISSVFGGNETGFIMNSITNSSSSTYFCDAGFTKYISLSGVGMVGGDWDSGNGNGIFRIEIGDPYTSSFAAVGARLAYI